MAGRPPKIDDERARSQICMLVDLLLHLGSSWPNVRVELFRLMQGKDALYDEVPSESTLERMLLDHFDCSNMTEYWEKRRDTLKIQLKRKAVTMALGGNTAMLIFCLKNLCGWADSPVQEVDPEDAKNKIKLAYNKDTGTA